MVEEVKQELIKRYKYLFENKELILSLAINKAIEVQSIQEDLKRLKRYKKNLKKYKKFDNYESLLSLVNASIADCEKNLLEAKYYLFDRIEMRFELMLEEFLFSDLDIEKSRLYEYIERIKNTPELLNSAMIKINGLKERRRSSLLLKDIEAFTVWKILTYVRNNNSNNEAVLKALDKYYNIERYMLTGINWNSGYYLLEIDEIMNEEFLVSIPCKYALDEFTTIFEHNAVMGNYYGNDYESEDDYFVYESEIEEHITKNKPKTEFMMNLAVGEMLSIDELHKLYCELYKMDAKTLQRKKQS